MKILHNSLIAAILLTFLLCASFCFGETRQEKLDVFWAENWLENYQNHSLLGDILPRIMTLNAHCKKIHGCEECCPGWNAERTGFLSGIIRKNSDRLYFLAIQFNEFKISNELVDAALYSRLPNALEIAKQLVENKPALAKTFSKELNASIAPEIEMAYPIEKSSLIIDFWEGEYYASGDFEPVKNIIQALQWYGTSPKENPIKSQAASEAVNFLRVLFRKDGIMTLICLNYQKTIQNKKVSTLLKKILERAIAINAVSAPGQISY